MLNIKNLNTSYNGTLVVKDFNLNIRENEIIGIVGESGSGKSTFLKSLIGITGEDSKVEGGEVIYKNKNILEYKSKELEKLRGSEISMVFQQPTLYLNPVTKIKNQFYDVVKDKSKTRKEVESEAISILNSLHLSNAKRILKSYPFELSGGINQRVCLAMSMINKPKLLLADEPTSALDVTVQVQVVKAMKQLRDKYGTSILIVSHNLGAIANMADTIGIMYYGKLVEIGTREEVLNNPQHQYTKLLLNSIPKMSGKLPKGIRGKIPDFGTKIDGCPFYTRCKSPSIKCSSEQPELKTISDRHFAYCNS